MQFIAQPTHLAESKAQCIIVSLFTDKTESTYFSELDKFTEGLISRLIKSDSTLAELAKTTLIHAELTPIKTKIILVGCGEHNQFNLEKAKKAITAVGNLLIDQKIKSVIWDILTISDSLAAEIAKQMPQVFGELTYRFDNYKSDKKSAIVLNQITLIYQDEKSIERINANLIQGQIISHAIESTKNVANMPPNVCNAHYLADQGLKLAQDHSSHITVSCLGEKQLTELGMNAYLAVGQGSQNESIMTVIEYHGANDKNAKPYVLVGKGLTFDSGGISIKPAAGMDEMKYDMCGAATVYGVMQAVAELKLPINIVGIMAGCENMPGNNAYRPGDILTSMSGKTIEVINTDAEGRLVLCDVLTYVERYQPEAVIDIATLTGACIVALGHHYTGVMGNQEQLVSELITASKNSGDKAWPLPIDEEFKKQVNSTCADIVNAAGRDGGTITAACFLSHFTEKYQWAHLDIAGTAWKSGANKGATGRPVAMLIEYLLSKANLS